KRAYRRLARRFHPDINPGDQAAATLFQQVLEAYETLIDRERRVRYDSGETAAPAEARRGGFEGFDFSSRGPDYSATFGDLVAEVLIEHGARRPAAARGADLHQQASISFAESFAGLDGPVKVRIPPGTQSGQRFRISERGMVSSRGGPRGDLVVEARLMLPAVLDERSKALLREFGEINGAGFRPRTSDDGAEG